MSNPEIDFQEQLSPLFEGFALQTNAKMETQSIQKYLYEKLGISFDVTPYGHHSINFDLTPKDLNLSPNDAWELNYRIRDLENVASIEPLFAIAIDGRPDWTEEIALPEDEVGIENFILSAASSFGFGSNENLPESDDFEWALKEMQVIQAWERFFPDWQTVPPGQGIIIGHPDTGYRRHPEIESNLRLENGYDFLDDDSDPLDELEKPFGVLIPNPGHGTAAASVIVSPKGGANEPYVSGVSPGTTLIPYRTSYSVVLSRQSVRNLARSIERAAQDGADVISVSMGAVQPSRRLREAVLEAQSQGVIVLGAAGNQVPWVVPPASIDEVIAVAGSNAKREIWSGSSFGEQVDVTAPGESVWRARATKNDDGQVNFFVERGSGTTFSVALTAGVAALWLAHHGGREAIAQRLGGVEYLGQIPGLFKQILRDSCTPVPDWEPTKYGQGLVNAENTLAANLDDYIDSVPMLNQSLSVVGVNTDEIFHEFQILFEQALSQVSTDDDPSDEGKSADQLALQLSDLLKTTPELLSEKLQDVGQELLFNFAVNPDSYKVFSRTLAEDQSSVDEGGPSLLTTSTFNDIRASLLSKSLSTKLAEQISE